MNVYTPTNVIVHEVDVHFESRIISKPIHVVQYDDRLPVVKVNLYTGNNGDEEYELPEGADVNIRYCRPDGHVVYNPVLGKDSTSNNVVYFEITQAMLIKNGKGRGVLEVTLNGKLACSSEIIFEIDRNPIQEDSIEATDEFKSVVQYAAEAESAASSVRDLTVGATTGEPGTEAAVVKSGGTGPNDPYHLQFTIPKGESGSAGNISVVAEEYSASKTYSEGQYVIHNNDLYVAKVDISTAEAWNANHWTKLNIGDALYDQKVKMDHKADIDGSYEDLTAGSAEQLLSSVFVEDNTPYSFRPSGGNLEIGNREEQRKIVGVSVVQNQLINPSSSQSSGTTDGVTVTNNNDGSYTLTGTKTSNANTYYYLMYSLPVGSKYVICGANTANAGGGGAEGGYNLFCAYLGVNYSFAKQQGSQPLIINPSDTTKDGWRLQLQFGYASGAINTYNETIRPMVINLTHRFGAEFADWLYTLPRAKYTEILYQLIPELNGGFIPHNTGVLESVNVSKHRMTQYNLWDEEWEVGAISVDTGLNIENPNTIRSTNYIKVIPDTTYYFQTPNNLAIRYYDINKNFIGVFDKNNAGNVSPVNNIRVTPSNCYFIRFQGLTGYGNTYNNDICISFYYDGERAGEYEPFKLHEYDYDSSVELRGMLKIDENGNIYADGDEYNADGSVKRKLGIANLGTAITSWNYEQRGGYGRFGSIQKLEGAPTTGGTNINIICVKYTPSNTLISNNNLNMAIALYNGTAYIRDDNCTSSAQLVTALQNVWIIYPLATITEETANPYTETQVVDNWGTEEFVDAQGRDFIIPVGHVTDYLQDLKAKLETAPNAPSENGDYLVRQSGSGTEYVPYTDGTRIDNLEETKANIDGYYGGMGVGIADNLNANEKIPLTKPYVLRPTAESEDVAGLYKRTHLTGGSLVWNQIVPETIQIVFNVTRSFSNGKFHITGTASANGTINVVSAVQPNHIYAFIGNFDLPEDFSSFVIRDITKSTNLKNISGMVTPFIYKLPADTSEVRAYFIVKNGVTYNFDYLYMCLDLTTTFGTTFANAIYSMNDHGLAWLYANFPELNGGYIPYSAPHFEHSKYKGVTSNGVNQLPAGFVIGKQWSNGVVIDAGNSSAVVIDKYICLPNTTYAITLPHINRTNVYAYAVFFDINGNYISSERNTLESDNHMVFTTPSNCYLFSFQVWRSGAVDFTESELVDPCVVIHYDTSYDGISEPYESWYTDLGSDVLKGIPVADDWNGTGTWSGKWHWEGDTKTPDGTITENFALVDMGTLVWSAPSGNVSGSQSLVSLMKKPADNYTTIGLRCTKYTESTRNALADGNIASVQNGAIAISDPNIAGKTATEVATYLSGVYLLYPLATPTTSQGTAYEENEQCHNWGIQWIEDAEYDDGNRAFKMPMGGEEVYTPNLTEKVEGMPSAPVNDGDYIVRVVNHKAEYIPLPNSFPEVPTSVDGTYDLVATVSNGTATLSWVLRS